MALEFHLKFLTYFLTIVEEQSLSRAAAKLGMSQPSLSQKLDTLESHLGFRLLNRTAGGAALTPEGEVLIEPFRKLVARGRQLNQLARDLSGEADRPVKIGVTMYSDIPERATLLSDFLSSSPSSKIQVNTIYTPELYEGILNAQFDLGFIIGTQPDDSFEFLTLRDFRTKLLIPKSMPIASQKSIKRADLVDLPIAVFKRDRYADLFDAVICPLEEAGAKIIQPVDQTPSGLVTYSLSHKFAVAMAVPFLDKIGDVGDLVPIDIESFDPVVSLMLVRSREIPTIVGAGLWDFARSWINRRGSLSQ